MLEYITLVVIFCQFAIAVSHSDCGQIDHCVADAQRNIWCSLFNNASTNDLVIMKTIIVNENISRATINDENVKIHWNTHTQDIILQVQSHNNCKQLMIPFAAFVDFDVDTHRLSESKRFRNTNFSRRKEFTSACTCRILQ